MRKVLFAALMLMAALVGAPAAAADDTQCVGLLPPGVHDNVVVPTGQTCIANGATIRGNVKVLERADFIAQAGTTIGGSAQGERDANVFIADSEIGGNVKTAGGLFSNVSLASSTVGDNVEAGELASVFIGVSTVGGNVITQAAARVLVQASRIGGNLDIKETISGPANLGVIVCGNRLPNGNIRVEKTRAGGVVVGLTFGFSCIGPPGNTVSKGSIEVVENNVDRVLDVSGNTVGQNVEVLKNTGPAPKTVQANTVGDTIRCHDNTPPFVGGPNIAQKREGQCF
jgi:hypothetical protein